MKNLILTLALSLGLLTTQATADTRESCYRQADIGFYIAESRDEGVHPSEVFNFLVQEGVDPNAASIVLQVIYIKFESSSPEEIFWIIFNNCIQQEL